MNANRLICAVIVTVVFFACKSKPAKNNIDAKKWLGAWERYERMNEGSLEIIRVTGDSIVFSLNAMRGANMGGVDSGKAILKGNTAIYTDGNCVLEFDFADSLITVIEQKGDCGAPLGGVLAGSYYSAKLKRPEVAREDSITMLENFTDDSLLRVLVGKDYSLFTESTQFTVEDEDLDSLRSRVYASGVSGLFTQMENIIMVDSAHNIWAAVIENSGDTSKVFYYTNRQDYINKLPKTLDKWRNRFKEYPVVYKSAK